MWHYRGTPHFLDAQAKRLGLSRVLTDRARNNPEIYRCSVLLAQLCERYHKARKEHGRPVFGFQERAQITGTLQQVGQESAKLHALAAASEAMLEEAHAELGIPREFANFTVGCVFDSPLTIPLGDGTVGAEIEAPSACAEPRRRPRPTLTSRDDLWLIYLPRSPRPACPGRTSSPTACRASSRR